MRNVLTYQPASSTRMTAARRAVGGRRAPVTARGRAVLNESRRRLQQAEAQTAYGEWQRIVP